jgi:VanZ family protein
VKKSKIATIIFISVIVLLCCAGIFKLSSMTSENSNGKSTDLVAIFIEDALDITNEYGITDSHPNSQKLAKATHLINAPLRKAAHASVYFVLAFIVCILFTIIFDHKKYLLSCLIALSIAIIFAATDEYHQTFVAGRTGQAIDVLIDSAGALVGILFYSSYHLAYVLGSKSTVKESSKTKKRSTK